MNHTVAGCRDVPDLLLGDPGTDRPLRAGMTLSANLVLERRSLWEVFLDPVLKAVRQ